MAGKRERNKRFEVEPAEFTDGFDVRGKSERSDIDTPRSVSLSNWLDSDTIYKDEDDWRWE